MGITHGVVDIVAILGLLCLVWRCVNILKKTVFTAGFVSICYLIHLYWNYNNWSLFNDTCMFVGTVQELLDIVHGVLNWWYSSSIGENDKILICEKLKNPLEYIHTQTHCVKAGENGENSHIRRTCYSSDEHGFCLCVDNSMKHVTDVALLTIGLYMSFVCIFIFMYLVVYILSCVSGKETPYRRLVWIRRNTIYRFSSSCAFYMIFVCVNLVFYTNFKHMNYTDHSMFFPVKYCIHGCRLFHATYGTFFRLFNDIGFLNMIRTWHVGVNNLTNVPLHLQIIFSIYRL